MPTLVYFDLGGRAEAMRLLLTHAKVDFEDRRLADPAFMEFKASDACPTGQLPVFITDEGKSLNQTVAILRYLGSKHGYIPDDLMARYYCDNAVDSTFGDLVTKEFYPKFMQDDELTEDDIKFCVERFVKYHAGLEKQMAAHGGQFIAGDSLSIAYFVVFATHTSSALNATCKHVNLRDALDASVTQFPLVSKWRASM